MEAWGHEGEVGWGGEGEPEWVSLWMLMAVATEMCDY